MMKNIINLKIFNFIFIFVVLSNILKANTDTIITFHFQQTFVNQYHPEFYAKYSGKNSLNSLEENCLSLTSTLFVGTKLWEGGEIYINPEISG